MFVLINKPLRRQLLEQRLRFLQIARVESFRKPPVNRSQQFARLLRLALVNPKAREVQGCGLWSHLTSTDGPTR